jgi:hypothetical protein
MEYFDLDKLAETEDKRNEAGRKLLIEVEGLVLGVIVFVVLVLVVVDL